MSLPVRQEVKERSSAYMGLYTLEALSHDMRAIFSTLRAWATPTMPH